MFKSCFVIVLCLKLIVLDYNKSFSEVERAESGVEVMKQQLSNLTRQLWLNMYKQDEVSTSEAVDTDEGTMKEQILNLTQQIKAIHDVVFAEGEKCDPEDAKFFNMSDPDRPHNSTFDAALGKPCQPPYNYGTDVCGYAVDGIKKTKYATNVGPMPWISVDLEACYHIDSIYVLPVLNTPQWFQNMKIYAGDQKMTTGDFSDHKLIVDYPGPWDGRTNLRFIPSEVVLARYVGIQSTTSGHLDLLTLQVFV